MQVSHKNQYVVNLIFFMFLSVHIEQISWVFAAMNIFRWWFSHSPVSGDVPQKTFSMRFSSVQSGIGWTFISVKCISGEDMQSMLFCHYVVFYLASLTVYYLGFWAQICFGFLYIYIVHCGQEREVWTLTHLLLIYYIGWKIYY
jgi:hypothetical protein